MYAVQCYVVPETNLLSIKQMCHAIGALNPGLDIIIGVHSEFWPYHMMIAALKRLLVWKFQLYCALKDTIYTKLALMPWIDDNLGHTLSGLTHIGNIIAKIFWKFYYFSNAL